MSPPKGLKSRNGCINCKRRRVKCDETRPICSNCMRREDPCSYSAQPSATLRQHPHAAPISNISPLTDTSENPNTHNRPKNLSRISPPPIFDHVCPVSPLELANRNMELMHHYCTVTADTLSIRKEILHVWKNAFPRQGYQHPFVMNGILALSAAHKASLLPSHRKAYLALADYYQTVGSAAFRPRLEHANSQNWMPLFSFATVLAMYMLARPLRWRMGATEDPISNLLDLIGLLRGIETTLTPLKSSIMTSEFAPLGYGTWPSDKTERQPEILPSLSDGILPLDTWIAISKLHAFMTIKVPCDRINHYYHAVDSLEQSAKFITLAGINAETGTVLSWVFQIDQIIFSDIRERVPHALVLLAYYCVFLATLEKNYWYSMGWAGQVFDMVGRDLAGQFEGEEIMEWPRRSLEFISHRIAATK